MSATVSVLIPVWNGERFLRDAIDSALNQTLSPAEVIVCDNASTDATPEILAEYARSDPRVRAYRNDENIGSARNFAAVASHATGDYLNWLPADDRLHPRHLALAVAALMAHSEAGLYFCGHEMIDAAGNVLSTHPQKAFRAGVVPGVQLVDHLIARGQPMAVAATVIPRRVFEAVGGLDTQFLGTCDYDLYLRIGGRYPAVVEAEPFAAVRWHSDQHSLRIVVRDNGDPDRLFDKLQAYDLLTEDQRRRFVEGLCDYARQYYSRPLSTTGLTAAEVQRHRQLVRDRLRRWRRSGLPYARYVRRWPRKPLALAAWLAGGSRAGVWLARQALGWVRPPMTHRPDEVRVDPGSELVNAG